ncbi:MAG: hypothetical protein JF886_13850 [Candidatus Dormibacteraeota bacterium]|uniref:Uncharacterized protein n=1 Tax=Candidatus Aeolococcus gillhamiae TaxID=3127015 RepID=A0A2W5Z6P9_9BACT|nr:hypothetical protein [Candidatus Dormibacteraeota bacterium]PZR79707.1 MAG: hypothetical protein DLM65_09965 [Candidatus Dormibacter sp. RRmetagenome_bin12]
MADPTLASALAKLVVEGGAGDAALRMMKAKRKGQPSDPGLMLRVAVAPDSFDLARETEITKTALLYGDTVELVSPTAAMLFVVRNLQSMTADERLTMSGPISALLGQADASTALPELRSLLRARHMSGRALVQQRKLQRGFDERWDEISAVGDRLWTEAGGRELDVAWDAGLLSFGLVQEAVADYDRLVDHFVDGLREAVQGTRAYPLFDDASGSLVSTAIAEGAWRIPELTARRVSEATMATGLVGNLPAYPTASMRGVIEAREALGEHLPAFRRAVTQLDAVANDPLDESFNDAIRDVYLKEVEPAFADIRTELARVEGSLLGAVGSTAPAPVIATALSFGHLDARVAAGLSAASWAVLAGARMLSERGGRLRSAKRHPFYLLYGANEHWS